MDREREHYKRQLVYPKASLVLEQITNKTICDDVMNVFDWLPTTFVDLMIIDPPYNLDKNFNGIRFSKTDDEIYLEYLKSWFPKVIRVLKPNASVYICGDWKSTFCLYQIMKEHTIIRNRITWQREKGRGAKTNWKNAMEDIWFGTIGNDYYFNVEAVKQKRKVIAPYRENGQPKDWEETDDGNFRLTHPGNFWDDISIPYWSMPENTDHPTQKPEKLIAKLILASCPENGIVFDPFLGSGTTSVVAKKLGRRYIGIEKNEEYCLWAEKRLTIAETNKTIQGYSNGVFWERNTLNLQLNEQKRTVAKKDNLSKSLF
jgi:site-specific DNA-methyltransferase (adenine-specific)